MKELILKTYKLIRHRVMPTLVYVSFGILFIWGIYLSFKSEADDHYLQEYACEVYMKDVKSAYAVSEAQLIKEVDKYIKTVAPESGVNARTLVEKCNKYDFDIKLALAQAHKESHFGTRGVATKTNSIFNIGAYDGLSAKQLLRKRRGYKHPDFSIEPYIQHVINNYLVNGKTEQDLLVKYTNKNGHRYASNPLYERDLLKIYNNIDSIANITESFLNFHKYKILLEN